MPAPNPRRRWVLTLEDARPTGHPDPDRPTPTTERRLAYLLKE